ncbi:DNA-3-methyladenine glycosylase [Corynebacterium uropygiale]|uniref:Putative 3-methyladenine DNA glycosylase n=1 Tax=Corynebacterium uropygiale TaxID=1775911 RepID=A0A9X1QMX1_9CORY|nr:DNA-3-methyladenine glycosylase [Corynebacterium uropygiale]MCF4005581.1 DNA-3-methyladenine glycosylase [Corynebacterium uropygiale]
MCIDFTQPADVVAPQLLGRVLCHGGVAIRLTEVEAYLGAEDPASHAFRGPTRRNAAMFGPGGHMYIYISYGIHRAGNIVCGPEGVGQGCLLRAGEVLRGASLAAQRRNLPGPDPRLARGPGNVGSALGFRVEDNHAPIRQQPILLDDAHPAHFHLLAPADLGFEGLADEEWVAGPRIGISKNQDAPLRFWIPGHPTVSARRGRPRGVSSAGG